MESLVAVFSLVKIFRTSLILMCVATRTMYLLHKHTVIYGDNMFTEFQNAVLPHFVLACRRQVVSQEVDVALSSGSPNLEKWRSVKIVVSFVLWFMYYSITS